MKIRRKYLFYALAFTSAIIAASVSAIDAKIINDIIVDDPFAFGVSCFIVGIVISLLITLVFSIPVKKGTIDIQKALDEAPKNDTWVPYPVAEDGNYTVTKEVHRVNPLLSGYIRRCVSLGLALPPTFEDAKKLAELKDWNGSRNTVMV